MAEIVYYKGFQKSNGRQVYIAKHPNDSNRVLVCEGGCHTGYNLSREEARQRYRLAERLSAEESRAIENRRQYEIHR